MHRGDTGARISHAEIHPVLVLAKCEGDRTAPRYELQGVRELVGDDLSQPYRVAVDADLGQVAEQLESRHDYGLVAPTHGKGARFRGAAARRGPCRTSARSPLRPWHTCRGRQRTLVDPCRSRPDGPGRDPVSRRRRTCAVPGRGVGRGGRRARPVAPLRALRLRSAAAGGIRGVSLPCRISSRTGHFGSFIGAAGANRRRTPHGVCGGHESGRGPAGVAAAGSSRPAVPPPQPSMPDCTQDRLAGVLRDETRGGCPT